MSGHLTNDQKNKERRRGLKATPFVYFTYGFHSF